ncbi:hypothetical protein BH09ACT1_BH09ACT1_06940 [soil metagenome]
MRKRTDTPVDDADALAVRRASRIVGLQITITSSILVVAVLVAAFTFIFSRIPAARLFDFHGRHETKIDVGGLDIVVAGLVIGASAIILAGFISWFATRRAVRPLGEALRIQRAFVADASHELRTPLAVLDARLQLFQRGLAGDDPATSTVAELRRDAKTLIDIVNDLLVLAEVGTESKNGEPVDVNPTVQLAAESMQVIAREKSVTITVEPASNLVTHLSAASLQRCMVALLDNAIDYAPAGSTVVVSLGRAKSTVHISVRDEGPGISGINPARIFDRFARSSEAVDGSGSPRASFGIGLSLVRETVERVGGSVSVVRSSAQGTEIELVIPSA